MAAPTETWRRLLLSGISCRCHAFMKVRTHMFIPEFQLYSRGQRKLSMLMIKSSVWTKHQIHKVTAPTRLLFRCTDSVNKKLNWLLRAGQSRLLSTSMVNSCLVNRKLVLGIESSCDDTGAAVVDERGNVLGEALRSQTAVHVEAGGIIPPVARDLHKKHIDKVARDALDDASVTLADLSAIAVTNRPGLPLSLLVGVEYAKTLAQQSGKPLIPVHHMEAHALTARMMHQVEFPFLVLLISGGHCLLAVAQSVDEFLLLGKGLDDAPGDAYDKTARSLKLKNLPQCLGLSGGRSIEVIAEGGDPKVFAVYHVMSTHANCNFSFSGIKTEFKFLIKTMEEKYDVKEAEVLPNVADVCASFQHSVLHHLAKRLQRALVFCEIKELLPNSKTLVVSGGVASNAFIRQGLETVCSRYNCQLICPPPKLCTDNGIMIAWNGMERLNAGLGFADDLDSVDIQGKCPLGTDITEEVEKCSIKLPRIKLP